jgi:uncharacterized protein (DUF433 family)
LHFARRSGESGGRIATDGYTKATPLAALRHHRGAAIVRKHPRPQNQTKRESQEIAMKFDRITIEPGKMNGQPCIRGLRITVRRVLEILAAQPSREELAADYPDLEDEDIRQALEFAAANLTDRIELEDYVAR